MKKDEKLTIQKVSTVLMKDMFCISKGETVAITTDALSHMDIVTAFFDKVLELGGIPMIIQVPVAKGDADAGMGDWPAEALSAALCNVDIWIEMGSITMLYSKIWETALAKNRKLRYLVIANSSIQSIERVFTGFDISILSHFLNTMLRLIEGARQVRITSNNGTDVSYEIDPNNALDIDDGDYSKPIFGTAPGYVNVVPRVGSMNGRIVFDELMNADVYNSDGHVEFIMTDGKIAEVIGNHEAKNFEAYLAEFEDPNMYKISHNMIGLNPNVRELSGEIVEDERIWGGVDFGFGHTSPIDLPPSGQMAKSHFDGVVAKVSLYLDGVMIINEGDICHPKLVELAEELVSYAI